MRFPPALRRAIAALLLCTAFAASPVAAENSVRAGEFVLHWSAVPTDTLTPEVARDAQVTRSANRALVNIAVRRGPVGGPDVAAPAKVSVAATNLAGQRMVVRMREHREGDAIYYLGEARFSGQDTLTFEVEAVPAGGRPIRTSFRQEFFPQ
jgi:hypothetical protein